MLVREMYRILELSPQCSNEDLKQSYRDLVKRYHPDLGGDPRKFDRVMQAYEGIRRIRPEERKKKTVKRAAPQLDLFQLGGQATGSADASERAFACRALGQTGLKSAYAFLRRALGDSSAVVVDVALEAIVKIGVRHAAGELAAAYSSGALSLKRALVDAIDRFHREELYRNIVKLALDDEAAELRKQGLRLFIRLKQKERRS